MKNKLFLFACSFALIGVLTSCGSSYDIQVFKEEDATQHLNDENVTYEINSLRNNWEVISEHSDYYYDKNSGEFYSVFNNKPLLGSGYEKNDLKHIYLGDNNTVYKLNDIYYDSFANNLFSDFGLDQNTNIINSKKYFITSKNSILYNSLIEYNLENSSKDLTIVEVDIITQLFDYYPEEQTYYILKGLNDTHYYAKNVYTEFDFYNKTNMFDETDLINDIRDIDVLNENEIRAKIDGNYYRFINGEKTNSFYNLSYHSNDTLNIRYFREPTLEQNDYTDILNINFTNTKIPFKYSIKKVNNISNDFDFVYEGEKYSAVYTKNNDLEFEHHPDFVLYPNLYYISKDSSYALALGKKILSDGNLSNTNYTFKIKNNFKVSYPIEDVSLFIDNYGGYIFNDVYYDLNKNENLIALGEDYAIIKNNDENTLTINNLYYINNLKFDTDFRLITRNLIDGVYLFSVINKDFTSINEEYYSTEYYLYDTKNNSISMIGKDIKLISNLGMYVNEDNILYIGGNEVFNYNSQDSYYTQNYSMFNQSKNIITYTKSDGEILKIEFFAKN